jgi:hypothetical protein
MGYYLTDEIYPSWTTFMKTIPKPRGNKKKYFAKTQETCRKDVEHAFGMLQSRFAIIHRSAAPKLLQTIKRSRTRKHIHN